MIHVMDSFKQVLLLAKSPNTWLAIILTLQRTLTLQNLLANDNYQLAVDQLT
jgi:hypothetical protein